MSKTPYEPPRWTMLVPAEAEKKLGPAAVAGGLEDEAGAGTPAPALVDFTGR